MRGDLDTIGTYVATTVGRKYENPKMTMPLPMFIVAMTIAKGDLKQETTSPQLNVPVFPARSLAGLSTVM